MTLLKAHRPTQFIVIFPQKSNFASSPLTSEFSELLLDRVFELAKAIHPNPCLIAWEPEFNSCYNFKLKKSVQIKSLCKFKKQIVAVNIGFLIQPLKTCRSFLKRADGSAYQLFADSSAAEILAASFPVNQINHCSPLRVLRHMIRTKDEVNQPMPSDLKHWQIFKLPVSFENSHIFAIIDEVRTPPHPMSSIYLNTAFQELINASPASTSPSKDDPSRLIHFLSALEKTSQVPWVFNTLVNELEFYTGHHQLASFPPEVHISSSGACNLECKFCTYFHSHARPAYIRLSQFKKALPFSRMHSLRLSSGLGEPMLNPHMTEIIHWVSKTHPHIVLNFFTNGLMLNRPDLLNAMVGKVRWINISLNAATKSTWQYLCGRDMFDRLINNIKRLNTFKKSRQSVLPVLHASMVINSFNIHELPKMPKLCRQLGIEKFTVIPFYSLNMHNTKKLNNHNTLAYFRHQYDLLYEETVLAAQLHGISIELPRSTQRLSVRFGLEKRDFYDFCRIGEPLPYNIHRLLPGLFNDSEKLRQCPDLWRHLLISHTYRNLDGYANFTHFRYPCLGPMCYSDFSMTAGVNLEKSNEVLNLNNHKIFQFLRKSQFQPGMNAVCDLCRGIDSRNPKTHTQFLEQLNEWQANLMKKKN